MTNRPEIQEPDAELQTMPSGTKVAMKALMTRSMRMQERLLIALTGMLIIGTCALDLALQADASTAALYIVPILFSLLSARQWFTLAVTIISLSFATLGLLPLLPDGAGEPVAPINRTLMLVVITAIACLILFYRRLSEEEKAAAARQREHEYAVPRLTALHGPLLMCPSRAPTGDNDGSWICLETYLEARSGAHYAYRLCPECRRKLYGSLAQRDGEKHGEPLLTR